MDAVATTVGLSLIAMGVVSIGLAIPLLQGKIGRNAMYGMRFRQSFQSDAAWFAINRYGAKRMIAWAAPIIALGCAALFLPLSAHPTFSLLFACLPLGFLLIAVLDTWRFAKQYAEKN